MFYCTDFNNWNVTLGHQVGESISVIGLTKKKTRLLGGPHGTPVDWINQKAISQNSNVIGWTGPHWTPLDWIDQKTLSPNSKVIGWPDLAVTSKNKVTARAPDWAAHPEKVRDTVFVPLPVSFVCFWCTSTSNHNCRAPKKGLANWRNDHLKTYFTDVFPHFIGTNTFFRSVFFWFVKFPTPQ